MKISSSLTAVMTLLVGALAYPAEPGEEICGACNPQVRPDECLESADPLAACERSSARNPYALAPRIALCDAYIASGDLMNAIITLRKGLDLCGGRSSYDCTRLQMALSNVEECDAGQAPDILRDRRLRLEVARGFCEGRSSGDAAVDACNQALMAFPEDPSIFSALGTKHLRRGESALAVSSYRRGLQAAPDDSAVREALAVAEQARRDQARACLDSRDLAMCDAAVLSGEEDEFDIQVLRAQLLADDASAALEALLIAQSLKPSNRQVASAILPLAMARLGSDPANPVLNLARADALLALGRVDAAILAYREVDDDFLMRTGGARRLVAARLQRTARVEGDCLDREDISVVPACQALILAGEPDERTIRTHIATLEQAEQERLEQARAQAMEQEKLRQEALARAAAAEAAAEAADVVPTEDIIEEPVLAAAELPVEPEPPPSLVNLAVDGRTF